MKKIIFIISVCSVFFASAQRNISIIYVDASESEKTLDKIQDKIKTYLDDDEVYLYISNNIVDDDGAFSSRSFFTDIPDEGMRWMNNKKLQKNPANTPDYFIDAIDINSYLWNNRCLSDINLENYQLNNNITFYFFLDEESYKYSKKRGDCIIDLIVNSNRLIADRKTGEFVKRLKINIEMSTSEGLELIPITKL